MLANGLHAQSPNANVIGQKLLERMAEAPDDYHSIHIVLSDRVDLEALDAQLSARRAMPNERSAAVINALKDKANATQGDLLAQLNSSPKVVANTVRGFWVANAIFVQAHTSLIAELSRRPEVAWIGLNGQLKLEKYEAVCAPPAPPIPNGREPGLTAIDAHELWAMGYTGYGQIAFTNDTGVDPNPPAISTKFRGIYAPGQESWFDYNPFTGGQTSNYNPEDCDAHGTHVTGTILGLDRLTHDTIGVAFNAQWVGAAILCGIGTEDNVAAFEWSLDPDGDPNTADDMPDIINNSWYDPTLGELDCFSLYVPVLEAMEAAGIAVVFSAGNEGPGPGSITQPHNININLVNTFTVGALDGNAASLPIAGFSSRGPSHCDAADSSLVIKPEVSAPGVSVRSCVPTGFDYYNGTSMASPHVSGAILLLKEAFPTLTGKDFKLALYYSCTDLGQPGEDNNYGMGIISVKKAFDYLVAQGHVPVSPYVANDILLIHMQVPDASCDLTVLPSILVENAGTDTITSFQALLEAGANSNLVTWTGTLAPLERKLVSLSLPVAQAGQYTVKCTLLNPNGIPDDRPLNNILFSETTVTSLLPLDAFAETGPASCEGTQALLRTNYQGPGVAEVTWFDAPFGGNVVGTGTAFPTAVLTEADTFFAQAVYHVPAGLPDHTVGDTVLLADNGLGLRFEVSVDCILRSVKVYSAKTGLRQIQLQDVLGEQIATAIEPVSQVGEGRIELNFNLEAGKKYRLVKISGKPFYANTSGADYPYVVDNIIKVTGTNNNQMPEAYHFFYDWDIEIAEPCGRTAVPVQVTPSGDNPAVSFTMSADSVNVLGNSTVVFNNTSADAGAAFFWNFGDGSTSTEENVVHTYTEPGIYIVSLTIESPDGCSGFALDTVEVVSEELSGTDEGPLADVPVAIFPNPTAGLLNVQFQLEQAQLVQLQLTDLTGRVIAVRSNFVSSRAVVPFDLAGFAGGVYFLTVKTNNGESVWKVVKVDD